MEKSTPNFQIDVPKNFTKNVPKTLDQCWVKTLMDVDRVASLQNNPVT